MDGTKVKNYLVKTLFEVKDPNWEVIDRSHEQELHKNYTEMHQLSLSTFSKRLTGDWEFKFLGGPVDTIHEAFVKTFWFIHDLWHREPCNILYTDPDTVAVKELDPWAFNGFRMFNFTDPKQFFVDNTYGAKFPYFFNAGVRFFGHDMHPEVWKTAAKLAASWDQTSYNTEQIILNAMLWMQGFRLDQVLKPEWAYQAQWLPVEPVWKQDIWNGISISQAKIIHVHGSRNSTLKLNLMKQLVS